VQPEAEPEVQPEAEPEVQPEAEPEVQPEAEPEVQPEAEPEVQPEAEPEVHPEAEPQESEADIDDTEAESEVEEVDSTAMQEATLNLHDGSVITDRIGSLSEGFSDLHSHSRLAKYFVYKAGLRHATHCSNESFSNIEDALRFCLLNRIRLNCNGITKIGRKFYPGKWTKFVPWDANIDNATGPGGVIILKQVIKHDMWHCLNMIENFRQNICPCVGLGNTSSCLACFASVRADATTTIKGEHICQHCEYCPSTNTHLCQPETECDRCNTTFHVFCVARQFMMSMEETLSYLNQDEEPEFICYKCDPSFRPTQSTTQSTSSVQALTLFNCSKCHGKKKSKRALCLNPCPHA
jgi:hypothetical protein